MHIFNEFWPAMAHWAVQMSNAWSFRTSLFLSSACRSLEAGVQTLFESKLDLRCLRYTGEIGPRTSCPNQKESGTKYNINLQFEGNWTLQSIMGAEQEGNQRPSSSGKRAQPHRCNARLEDFVSVKIFFLSIIL